LEYLDDELDYLPWVVAEEQINYVDNMLKNTEVYGKFKVGRPC